MILVTGANGFVGRPLCAALAHSGQAVVAATRHAFSDVVPNILNFRISTLSADFNWQRGLQGCDAIVHLAGRAHVMSDKATDPLTEFRRVNVDGTLNLARQAVAAGVRRFVFISSIKVNGEFTRLGRAFAADDVPAPEDPYGISKLEAEQALQLVALETGMEVVIIRPPLVYGPVVKGNFLTMLRWLEKGLPLPLGSIQNKRSLLALANLVDFIIVCLEHPAAMNQIFLVSDGEDISTTELLRRTSVAMGQPARLLPIPQVIVQSGLKFMGKGDLAQRLCGSLQVDISKARNLLGWNPPVSMDESLAKTAKHFLASQS